MAYPRLEARRVEHEQGWLVAVINHATTGDPVMTRLPWPRGDLYAVRDLTAEGTQVDPDTVQTFAPLAVRLYQYQRKR